MLFNILGIVLGLILFNISIQSLKRSAIRKWRQGFTITLITSLAVLAYGFMGLLIEMPLAASNAMLFLSTSSMAFSVFLISKMNGLNA